MLSGKGEGAGDLKFGGSFMGLAGAGSRRENPQIRSLL